MPLFLHLRSVFRFWLAPGVKISVLVAKARILRPWRENELSHFRAENIHVYSPDFILILIFDLLSFSAIYTTQKVKGHLRKPMLHSPYGVYFLHNVCNC